MSLKKASSTVDRLEKSSERSEDASSTSIPISQISLNGLPTEILLGIAHNLPLSSAAILTLVSRRLYLILGKRYLDTIKQSYAPHSRFDLIRPRTGTEQERENFLLLLQKDLAWGKTIFCYHCHKLHDPERTDTSRWSADDALSCSQVDLSSRFFHDGFNFSRVQYAMQLHRAGRDAASALSRLSSSLTKHTHEYTYHHDVTARIVANRLYVKQQHWITQRAKLGESLSIPPLLVCDHHWRFQDLPPRGNLCELFHRSQNIYCIEEGWRVLHTCCRCQTEFQCEVREMDDGWIAIGITVWQGLGMGRTPLDAIWLSRFQTLKHYFGIHYDVGSLQSALEHPA